MQRGLCGGPPGVVCCGRGMPSRQHGGADRRRTGTSSPRRRRKRRDANAGTAAALSGSRQSQPQSAVVRLFPRTPERGAVSNKDLATAVAELPVAWRRGRVIAIWRPGRIDRAADRHRRSSRGDARHRGGGEPHNGRERHSGRHQHRGAAVPRARHRRRKSKIPATRAPSSALRPPAPRSSACRSTTTDL